MLVNEKGVAGILLFEKLTNPEIVIRNVVPASFVRIRIYRIKGFSGFFSPLLTSKISLQSVFRFSTSSNIFIGLYFSFLQSLISNGGH
jgi:hypothetical protein